MIKYIIISVCALLILGEFVAFLYWLCKEPTYWYDGEEHPYDS